MKRLLLDVDGVCADFLGAALKATTSITGVPYLKSSIRQWSFMDQLQLSSIQKRKVFDLIHTPGFCGALQPLPGAIEGVQALQPLADLYFVTTPFHSKTWCYERTHWLHKHMGVAPEQIVFATNKHVVSGDCIVDDKPTNVEQWKQANPNGLGLLWATTQNEPYWGLVPTAHEWRTIGAVLQ